VEYLDQQLLLRLPQCSTALPINCITEDYQLDVAAPQLDPTRPRRLCILGQEDEGNIDISLNNLKVQNRKDRAAFFSTGRGY